MHNRFYIHYYTNHKSCNTIIRCLPIHYPPPPQCISFITPLYNRKHTIARALNSVRNQTNRNIEHIIVDDGSTDNPDEIILSYLENADYPVLYIKKENGGVHTARNLAIKNARGEFILFLDSDDEFIPEAGEEFIKAWNEIPQSERKYYREIVALCKTPEGKQIGNRFVDGINKMTKAQADKARKCSHGEHTAMNITKLLQTTTWPEPTDVSFVTESIVWNQLDHKYRKWFLNKCLRIYYTDSTDSISKQFKLKNIQNSINHLFQYQYILNNPDKFNLTMVDKIKNIVLYLIFFDYLKSHKKLPENDWTSTGIQGKTNKLLKHILYIPSILLRRTLLRKRFV